MDLELVKDQREMKSLAKTSNSSQGAPGNKKV